MLDLAINYKEELTIKRRKALMNPTYKYYFDAYMTYNIEIAEDNWNKLEMVSIKDDEILGYLVVSYDRPSNYAYALSVINFADKGNITFAKDFYSFVKNIFDEHWDKLKFNMIVGNPIESMYDRFIKKYGGRIVGRYENDAKLLDGSLHDVKLYEIMHKNYEDTITKKYR